MRRLKNMTKGAIMRKNVLRTIITLTSVFLIGNTMNAMAETLWEKTHPRRDQVNDRLERQHYRIHQEVKEGDMTHAQAMRLHRADYSVRREERLMASQHKGHITRRQQGILNRQENRISRRIGQ